MSNKKIKIAFLSKYDYANVLTNWSYGINKYLGNVESKSFSFEPHIFKYNLKHDYDLTSIDDDEILNKIRAYILHADYIVVAEEVYPSSKRMSVLNKFILKLNIKNMNLINAYKQKKIIIFHGGSVYRNKYASLNKQRSRYLYNLHSPDLYRLSKQEENDLVIFPTLHLEEEDIPSEDDIKKMISDRKCQILHTPSNKKTKNSRLISKNINSIVEYLNNNNITYRSISGLPNDLILQHKKHALFFIDQFNTWGGLGVSAIEAMAFGSIVFCSMQNSPQPVFSRFSNSRKEIPLVYLNFPDENDLTKKIKLYTSFSEDKLLMISLNSRRYYLDNFSPKAAAASFNRFIVR